MPKTTAELLALLDLERIDDDIWRGGHPDALMPRTYGGQIMAQAIVAGQLCGGDDKIVNSLHGYFLASGRPDQDTTFRVTSLREGASFATRRVDATQGRPLFSMSASWHVDETGLDHADPAPTGVPDPETCRPLIDVLSERFGASPVWHEWDALDVRFAGDTHDNSGNLPPGRPRMQVWVRTADAMPATQLLHRAVLAYASDLTLLSVATLPHEVVFLSPQLQVATLDHAMWFHRDVRADDWLLYDMVSSTASHSVGHCSGRLYQDGRIVASCVQEGLIRMVDDRPILT